MISVRPFGTTNNGDEAHLYILENDVSSVYITDYGANIVSFNVPDKSGNLTDIILGFDDVSYYCGDVGCIGATIGRFANRIENGRFDLNGKTYKLAINNGPNHLHGGLQGFNRKMFSAEITGDTLKLSLFSPDMDEGYPGNLKLTVSFTLNDSDFEIEYAATSDKDTVINFTNHSYFNLDGALSEDLIYNQYLTVYADAYCETDKNCLADGKIIPVRNTEMDFRTPILLGDRLINQKGAIKDTTGLDHNFVLSFTHGELKKAATVFSPKTGIVIDCITDQPGVQIYTANFLDVENGKGFTHYKKHGAICLETQHFPNAMEFSYFPSPILKANDVFKSKTIYRFSVK